MIVETPERYGPELGQTDFQKIRTYIFNHCGIRLGPEKRVMVQSRLHSRLKAMEIENFSDYVKLVLDSEKTHPEIIHMVDRITTNKTEFYREPAHFEFLERIILPEYRQKNGSRHFTVWSAACSSGEEPFTIAMVLQTFAEQHPAFRYSVLGTDLSTKMLSLAKTAVYNESRIEPLPTSFRKKYFLKSKAREDQLVRVVPEIRANVSFDIANLLNDNMSRYGVYDVIFCRNVLIYFDRATQQKVIESLCKQLHTGGYLLTGHSEALTNFDVPLIQIKPAVYKKT